MADDRRTKRHALPPPALEMAAPHTHRECSQACVATGTNQTYVFGTCILLPGKPDDRKALRLCWRPQQAIAGEPVADLVLHPHGALMSAREVARRVVKGDLSPSTTTSSAGTKLNHNEHDRDSTLSERQRFDGRAGGSSPDAYS